MIRFIQEYANFKKRILEGFEDSHDVERYNNDIDKILRLKQRELLTTEETMKALTSIDTYDYNNLNLNALMSL